MKPTTPSVNDTKKKTVKAWAIKVGDEVFIEQAWEDQAGNYHDEHATVSRIYPDGRLQFRIGHWKTRKAREQKLQAFLNAMEWYSEDVQKI